ncbi:hypothetical protein K2173_013169 [Erythroxylum novogranatense]|uniref:Cation-transporting P-type ATPase N-terminal domain-containing protein n=1 Tax=Erythroxylum novogranatense TaxID=1862640 RepID=A0AAV8TF23_9ROSI|nr:hypothetical protein K2173_013169 [Erythroxylum novogranatense]
MKKVNGRSVSYVAPEAGHFGIDQATLSQLVKEENVQKLEDMEELKNKGIRGDDEDIFNRQKSFGSNIYENPYTESFFIFQLKAMKDPLVILLINIPIDELLVGEVVSPRTGGSMVIKGYARMHVRAVGKNTTWDEILAKKWKDSQKSTPLQTQLNKMAAVIGNVALSIGFLAFVVWLIRYFVGRRNENIWGKPKFGVISDIVGIIATSVAIASGAFVDGLVYDKKKPLQGG